MLKGSYPHNTLLYVGAIYYNVLVLADSRCVCSVIHNDIFVFTLVSFAISSKKSQMKFQGEYI